MKQVVSSLLAGAAVGSLAGSGLADSLGRRRAFLLDAVPMLAGPLISASATGLVAMLAGRLLTGVGIGLSSALVPLYISEVGGAVCWPGGLADGGRRRAPRRGCAVCWTGGTAELQLLCRP